MSIPDIQAPLQTLLILALAGGFAGLTSGLFGIGGGIIMVPVLFWYFGAYYPDIGQLMHFAVATSLAMIVLNGLISFLAHKKYGSIDSHHLRKWGWQIGLGACLGGFAALLFDSVYLTALFALFALCIALQLWMTSADLDKNQSTQSGIVPKLANFPILPPIIGFLSALFGIGGGTLSVPAMIYRGVPTPKAIGTSSIFGLFIAVAALVGFTSMRPQSDETLPLTVGFVYLPALMMMVPMAALGAPLGAKWANQFNPLWLRRMFGTLVGLGALRMFITLF